MQSFPQTASHNLRFSQLVIINNHPPIPQTVFIFCDITNFWEDPLDEQFSTQPADHDYGFISRPNHCY